MNKPPCKRGGSQRTAHAVEADRARQEDIRRESKKEKKKMVKIKSVTAAEPVESQVDANHGTTEQLDPIDQDERDAQRFIHDDVEFCDSEDYYTILRPTR